MNNLMETIYKPDVLSCLSDLSNDEVITPPELANAMLDLLPKEIWNDPTIRILDPACKSGVFLREAAKRFIEGEKEIIPNLQERIDHIMHNQLYGIAITELTSLMSRRTLYCSKYPNGPFSISKFDNVEGNVRYKRINHTWNGNSCIYCGASKEYYQRSRDLETHAYEFIHLKNEKEIQQMNFDVILGNVPYQLNDGGGNGASAKPIYQEFILQAIKLKPRYITMITPSRWFSGGKGLDSFRDTMLKDDRLCIIHDFPDAGDCFKGVSIKGGVSYFLWDKSHHGLCKVYNHNGDQINGPVERALLEDGCDTFIRYNIGVEILRKVQSFNEKSFMDLVSARMPFGFPNTFKGNVNKLNPTDLEIYVSGNDREIRGTIAYVPNSDVIKGREMIDWEKVYISKAGSGSDSFPHSILTKPFYGAPGTICNESYLVIGGFNSKNECLNVMSYISTKLFRFLVLLKKSSQNTARGVYQFVPVQDFSHTWTDEMLYEKYGISEDEIAFIDSMVRPMELDGD